MKVVNTKLEKWAGPAAETYLITVGYVLTQDDNDYINGIRPDEIITREDFFQRAADLYIEYMRYQKEK